MHAAGWISHSVSAPALQATYGCICICCLRLTAFKLMGVVHANRQQRRCYGSSYRTRLSVQWIWSMEVEDFWFRFPDQLTRMGMCSVRLWFRRRRRVGGGRWCRRHMRQGGDVLGAEPHPVPRKRARVHSTRWSCARGLFAVLVVWQWVPEPMLSFQSLCSPRQSTRSRNAASCVKALAATAFRLHHQHLSDHLPRRYRSRRLCGHL